MFMPLFFDYEALASLSNLLALKKAMYVLNRCHHSILGPCRRQKELKKVNQ